MNEFKNKLIVHGLMQMNHQYLVIQRSIIKRGKPNVFPQYWDIPGGSVEDYETPRDALIREAKEEVNLDIQVLKIIHEDSQYDQEKNTVFTRLVYECEIMNPKSSHIQLDPEEHSRYQLILSLHDLQDEKVLPYLKEILTKRNS